LHTLTLVYKEGHLQITTRNEKYNSLRSIIYSFLYLSLFSYLYKKKRKKRREAKKEAAKLRMAEAGLTAAASFALGVKEEELDEHVVGAQGLLVVA